MAARSNTPDFAYLRPKRCHFAFKATEELSVQHQAIMNTYGRLPVTFSHAKGAYVYDDKGNSYLDALSGIAVCGLGHAHPAVTQAICEQADNLVHVSNLYGINRQNELAEKLTKISGMDNVFFSNSGAEANEAAIKIARKYGNEKGVELPTILVAENAFHGRTMATLTATGNKNAQAGFGPLLDGFERVPYNDLEAAKKAIEKNPNIVAVLIEPVQGEGGVTAGLDDYLTGLRKLCDQNDLLYMLDEIQTGNGRTGQYFAYQHYNWKPDVVTTAKGLGNGVPIGACLAKGKAAEVLQPGSHGSTYGGNPLACSAGCAVIDTITSANLCERVQALGERIRHQLQSHLDNQQVTEYRGKGLMIGIVLNTDEACGAIMKMALDEGLLLNVTAGNVVRLLPPFILTDEQADTVAEKTANVIKAFLAEKQ
ncbi:acetylornithine aminotransferase [Oceanobacter sp. RED65]|uniref:Acetylornithine aminotransferase n=1 Tax=Bermanella marisrubri TaxID=207949 RepID=Q1N4F8_9GAMM|nr:acetylornithine aminotransferase [Oceanobacter sp. RED65] [Bermanella marisrubri]